MILLSESILDRNNVNIVGSGEKALIFAHGFGADQRVWDKVFPSFTSTHKVILFDYVGSGNSDKSSYSVDRYNDLHGYAKDLSEICKHLQLDSPILIGHSVSSMIGVLTSIANPGLFKKLILICPSPSYINEPKSGYIGGFDRDEIEGLLMMMEKNYKEWAKHLAPVAMKNEDRPELAKDFEETLNANTPHIAKQFAEVTFYADVRSELCKVTTPSLILQTRDDSIAPVEVGEYVHQKLQDSKFVLMSATGHNPHVSHPEELISCIKDYLHLE